MPLSYDYDESSETWPFFLLTLLCVVLIPLTIAQLYALLKSENSEKATRQKSPLDELDERYTSAKMIDFQKKFSNKRSKLTSKRTIFVVVGWAIVALLVNKIGGNEAIKEAASSLFDPYELLGIATSATEKEVKSAYRKLSVKFHPDKLSKDLTEQQRLDMEEQYVLITKAYKALTDELTRENFLRYGHPDGPQATSHGIALPKFLVNSSGSPLVIISYIAMLGFILPFFVSRWWSRTQSFTKKGIHVKSASYFADRLFNFKPSQVVTVDMIIKWLSHAEEFKIFYPNLTPSVFESLLHDHLNRSSSSDLEDVKLRIVAKTHSLLFGLLDIATSFRNLEITNVTLDTFKSIVQATPSGPYSQILQLPNVNQKAFLEGAVDDIRTLGKLFTFDDKKIGKILGIDDEGKLKDTLTVASQIPHLKIVRAEFKVPGEPVVTPSSTPHIVLKVMVRSARHKFFTPNKIPDEMCSEPQDFDSLRDPFASTLEQPVIPETFAPYFPVKRTGSWCCIVVLQKDGKVIQTPMITNRLSFVNLSKDFDKRKVKDVDSEFDPKEWEVGTIKIPFSQPAPPQKGDYFFRVIVKNTDYFGADLDITMPMSVRDPPHIETLENEYGDINSEDEEDTEFEEDSNDELDDDDSDYTDIDTDTDVDEEDEKQ
ncbi:LAFE_0G08130g1_1 [Lachancea fermentati]|uniref:LAFE_0G08130g1_1 n=1 Tax=Lachancea fermentati TaxID=4955 RepID=A0A1G4MHL5_LACFM|nr:LAFE_0G08130g1_1 [Lachancea fermentati]